MRRRTFLYASALLAGGACAERLGAAGPIERRLYVTNETGISVYDIDRGHAFLRRIDILNSGDYKGIAVSPQSGRLYVTSHRLDELICLDLSSDAIVWRKNVGPYADSHWVTPDGRRIYLPTRGDIFWRVLDAQDGSEVARISTERGRNYDVDPIGDIGPHNTWINRTGTRVYMEVLTVPYVYVADTATNEVLGKIGPFAKGVRPFAVADNERLLFANVDGLLGFEVAEITRAPWGGRVIHRAKARTPPERFAEIPEPPAVKPHSTPSHGVAVRPDQREVWVVDGVYGYVHVFNVAWFPPTQVASIPIFADRGERPHPGWIAFGIDGRYAYPDGGAVIDTATKQVVARIPTSEKLIEIDFQDGHVVAAGHR
jgi:DNA-binding beta-propeller fold protein YncE